MRFGRGLCEGAVSNLFENVSLTRRAREGACGAHRGPMPPSAVGLLRPVPAAAAWRPHAGPPAPGLTGTEEVQERSRGCLSGPGSPLRSQTGEAPLSADSPGASGVSFSQVPINDDAPLSHSSSSCPAQDGFGVGAEADAPDTGASPSPVDTPGLWFPGRGRGAKREAAEAGRGALPLSSAHARDPPLSRALRVAKVRAVPKVSLPGSAGLGRTSGSVSL